MRPDIEIYNKECQKLELCVFIGEQKNIAAIEKYCLGGNTFCFIIVDKDKFYYYDGLRNWASDDFDMTEFSTAKLLNIFDMVPEKEERLFIIQILSFIYGVRDMPKYNLQFDDDTNQLLLDLGAIIFNYDIRFNAGNRVSNIKVGNILS